MDTQPLLHDEITELGNNTNTVDDQQPCCSHASIDQPPEHADPPSEDGLPGIVVSYQGSSERTIPIIPNDEPVPEEQGEEEEEPRKVYTSRFYIVMVFSMLGFMQGGLTLSWNVIAESVEAAFGWNEQTLSFMQSWIYISYLMSIPFFAYLMGTKGLRISMIITGFLLTLGTALRCISVTPPGVTWCAHVGHFLIGLAGPVAFTGGPVVSSLWYPPSGRTTATAFMTIAGFGGSAVCFITGPLFVHSPIPGGNGTGPAMVHYTNIAQIKQEILHLRYGECAVCGLIFLLILIHFPSKPPTPPSVTAAMDKLELLSGLKQLITKKGNRHFWLVAASYGLSTGIYAVWSGLFAVNLKALGLTELQSGWIGFVSVCMGCLFAVLFGYWADHWKGHMKMMILFLLTGCILFTYGFVYAYYRLPEHYIVWIWVCCVLQGICNNAPIPLFFELAIESAFPVPEVVTSAVMSILFNIFPPLFLAVFQLNIGTSWMNWAMYVALLACFPMMLLFKEHYHRLALDTHNRDLDGEPGEVSSEDSREIDPEEGTSGVSPAIQRRHVSQYGSINA